VTQRGGGVTSTCHSTMSKCPAPMEALVPARTALWLAEYSVNIRLIKKWKSMGLRTAFSPPYLHISWSTDQHVSGHSTGSFGCPTVLYCTEPYPVYGACVAAPLVWPCLPLDCHTRHSHNIFLWQKRHGRLPSDAHQWNAVFYLLLYIYSYDKNDTAVRPTVTPISGMPCFFNYNIFILMAKTTRF
jgi:hypothetical protein